MFCSKASELLNKMNKIPKTIHKITIKIFFYNLNAQQRVYVADENQSRLKLFNLTLISIKFHKSLQH